MEKFFEFTVQHKIILLLLVLAVAIVFPFCSSNAYILRIGTMALMYVMLTLSLNLLSGILGQMSFGHAAFWGIGAYVAAILGTQFQLDGIVSFAIAGVIAGGFGLLLGLPVMHLKKQYFVIVTMVFCEIIRVIELNWMTLTGGALGIKSIPKPSFFGLQIANKLHFYYLILVLVILTTIMMKWLLSSKIGYALLSIRDDEIAASSMGINVYKYKVLTIGLSAALAGIAGAFYAHYSTYIDPTLFTNNQSNSMLVMVILGGLGNVVGSFVGAIVLTILPELLRGFELYRYVIYGVMLVFLMLVRPDGLLGSVNFKYVGQRLHARKEVKENKNS